MTRTRPQSSADHGRQARADADLWFAAVNFLVGAWLLVSPSLFTGSLVDEWDDVAIGVVLVVLAGYGLYLRSRRRPVPAPLVVICTVAGLWLLAFSIDFGDGAVLMYESVVTGSVLAVSNGYLYRRYFRLGWEW